MSSNTNQTENESIGTEVAEFIDANTTSSRSRNKKPTFNVCQFLKSI